MDGSKVKKYIQDNGIKLWRVADELGMTDSNFSRRLRYKFTRSEFEDIKNIVKSLKPDKSDK